MRPSDVPILLPFHVEQNKRDNTDYPLPRMFDAQGKRDSNIALALSMTKDDIPVQGVYFCKNNAVEMCFAGCNPRATIYSAREIEAVRYTLRAMKYEVINCKIPLSMADMLQRPMEDAGFRRTDDRFATFYQELHPEGE